MNDIVVSVVVATYKRGTALKNALESLSNQTYKNFEIVLVDDNSNEEWNEKVKNTVCSFKEKHPDIAFKYIINNQNQGSAKTRNIGIEAAEGEYITFLDDDDVYLPEKINNQVKFMGDGNYDYSITDLDLYSENDVLIEHRTREFIKKTDQDSLIRYHLMHHLTGTDTMMFKKEYLIKIGCFAPIDVGDEFYLMLRAIKGHGNFGYMPECNIKAYVHTGEGGLSSGQSKIDGENALYEYKKSLFNQIDKHSIKYIKMRHHAVLAFAYLRMKKPLTTIKHGLISFVSSPISLMKLLKERKQ